jgi:hypothetical protein
MVLQELRNSLYRNLILRNNRTFVKDYIKGGGAQA